MNVELDAPHGPQCALGWSRSGSTLPMPALHDEEGARLPGQHPPVVDVHVQLFQDRVFDAVWRWFEQYIAEVCAEYFPAPFPDRLLCSRPERIL